MIFDTMSVRSQLNSRNEFENNTLNLIKEE